MTKTGDYAPFVFGIIGGVRMKSPSRVKYVTNNSVIFLGVRLVTSSDLDFKHTFSDRKHNHYMLEPGQEAPTSFVKGLLPLGHFAVHLK